MVEWLRGSGKRVFLDLKLHDIPTTVRGAAQSAAALDVQLLTVHASGGEPMLRAAVEGAGDGVGILGVTVLTSPTLAELAEARGYAVESLAGEVLRLSGVAARAGAHGVVCAGPEVGPSAPRTGRPCARWCRASGWVERRRTIRRGS